MLEVRTIMSPPDADFVSIISRLIDEGRKPPYVVPPLDRPTNYTAEVQIARNKLAAGAERLSWISGSYGCGKSCFAITLRLASKLRDSAVFPSGLRYHCVTRTLNLLTFIFPCNTQVYSSSLCLQWKALRLACSALLVAA